MKFKIINKLVLLIASFTVINIVAQGNSVKLKGTVLYDSINLLDINILNKATLSGTASDADGSFTLYAKKGDSILVSSLEFQNRILKITETHLKSKSIIVYLEPSINRLDEIMIIKVGWLNSINIVVSKGTILDNDNITNRKAPNARRLTDPPANASGLNPITIITALIKAITKKSRLKRKEKKITHEKIQQLKNEFPITIRDLYGNDFFVEWLHIPEDNINLFMGYCEGNGFSELYNSNEITIKNFLLLKAEKFNSFRN
ncbi:MAG: hypothetical protein COC16_04930 [Lutibacter sp.]|nr:MAG: hypothetical protein COC16_04930 [Lutibacter sp.]